MQKPESFVRLSVVFWCLAVALGACGDDATGTPSMDAAVDVARDTSPRDVLVTDAVPSKDTSSLKDTAPRDTAPSDGRVVDAPQVDAPLLDASSADGATGDGALPPDTKPGSGKVDADTRPMPTITFKFKNTGTQPLYLFSECTTPIVVTAVVDGKTYGNAWACACDCASSSCKGGVACGACMPANGLLVDVGGTQEITWMARTSTLETRTDSTVPYQCVRLAPIPAGAYMVAIVVYKTAADAVAKTNGKTIERSFTLGASNATWEVPIQ